MEEEGEGLPGARPTKQLVQNQLNKKTPANSQKNGLATMLPEDTVKKLQDKPGEGGRGNGGRRVVKVRGNEVRRQPGKG